MKNTCLAFMLVLVLAFGVSAQTTSKVVPLAVVTYEDTWTLPTVSFPASEFLGETSFGVMTHFNVQGTTRISQINFCIYKSSGELIDVAKLVGMAPFPDGDYDRSVLLRIPEVPGIYKIVVKFGYNNAIKKTHSCKIHVY